MQRSYKSDRSIVEVLEALPAGSSSVAVGGDGGASRLEVLDTEPLSNLFLGDVIVIAIVVAVRMKA
jgi:hypothetical protein